jgi:hypothetical protein
LRKEFGSQINALYGIHAASRALRHADIAVTNQFYADSQARVRLGLGHLLSGSSEKVVNIQAPTLVKKAAKQAAKRATS